MVTAQEVVAYACNPAVGRWRQEDQVRISLDYTMNARPAWATCHPVSKSWRRRMGGGRG